MAATNIPLAIYSLLFIKFVSAQIKQFKQQNGFGRWLVEYQDMDNKGLFEPKQIRKQFIKILCGTYDLGFIRKQAIWYICLNALDAIKDYDEDSIFDIRLSTTGEIALDDDDNELDCLSLDDAISICLQMNTEEGKLLYNVYDSDLDELIM